ncbi:MAG: response regulator [Acidobacteriota bacterium]
MDMMTRDELESELKAARSRITELEEALASGSCASNRSSTLASLNPNAALDLRESGILLEQVLNALPARVFWKDADLNYLGGNKAFAADAGYDRPEDIVEKSDFDMAWTEQAEAQRAGDRAIMASGVAMIGSEEARITSDGGQKWIRINKIPLLDADGVIKGVLGAYEDITRGRQTELALRESEARSRRLLTSVASCTFTATLDSGNVPRMIHGSECEAVTGYTSEDYEADPNLTQKMIHPEDREAVRDCTRRFLDSHGEGCSEISHRIFHKDGSVRWISSTAVPRRDASGRMTSYDGLFVDITERRRIRDELLRAKEAAESARRAKSEFMANMSHEIRTPMNAILCLTRLALRDELSGEQRRFLEGVLEAGTSLKQIINDVLDFSRIEAGRLDLESELFALRPLLDTIVEAFARKSHSKGIALKLHVDDTVPDVLQGDPERLRQVIANLLGNALKFTREGMVELSVWPHQPVQAQEGDAQRVRLLFMVRDTGIGIAKDKLETIFESFTQADSSTTKLFGGTGLGLAISKKLTGMMHGDIWAESEPGSGSTFKFTAAFSVPPGQSGEGVGAARAIPVPTGDHGTLRILVAEDDRMNQMFAESFLKRAGHSVAIAANGKQAVEMLGLERYDLVLMDIAMPEMDGLEATRIIRSSKSGTFDPDIPIIVMTAHALKGDRERFLAAGADGYIAKPVDLDELTRELELAMEGSARRAAPSGAGPHHDEQELPDLDTAWFDSHFGDKSDLQEKLIDIFKVELPRRLGEIREAVNGGNHDRLAESAHALKGASGVIGASAVRQCAANLERAARSVPPIQADQFLLELEEATGRVMELLLKEFP